ncbi:uncharacterized protein N7459_006673 [Penicillium hispanicum]|uniref:uncharacterized protein n=1 Tax=Penicillium hispanicum TaxID=1080232 RepID=UPI0025400FC5|nr:uncharacterized protein N7459_006673 [Penicillium hispanicum]KAJ5577709.1 hypothetical protein N7459_006673 [Penicillium hispanicum]
MPELLTITFIEYGIGMTFLGIRLLVQIHLSGVRGLRLDDVFAVTAMVFYTLQTVFIAFLSIFPRGRYSSNIGLNEKTALLIPESSMASLTLGSRLAFMNWIWYMCFIWCLKGTRNMASPSCLGRGGLLRPDLAGVYPDTHLHLHAGPSELAGPALSRSHPPPQSHCLSPIPSKSHEHSSDLLILAIPILILTKLQLPLQRKLMLAVMFSSGIYIIICAVLRAHYSLGDITSFSNALTWADRECFITAIMVSLPGIRPVFQNTHLWGPTACKKPRVRSHIHERSDSFGAAAPGQTRTSISSPCSGRRSRHFELDRALWPAMGIGSQGVSGGGVASSPRAVNGVSAPVRSASRYPGLRRPLEIHVTTAYTLESKYGEPGRASRSGA